VADVKALALARAAKHTPTPSAKLSKEATRVIRFRPIIPCRAPVEKAFVG